jgi:membrane protein EpsK
MIPIIIIVSFFIPKIFNVPMGQEQETIFLFLGIFAAFLISSWSGNFTVQLFAYNRLDLQNIVNATNIVVSTVLIFIFFHVYSPSLIIVGTAYMIGAISASVFSIVLAKRVCPHLKISFHYFDNNKLKAIGNMGLWAIVNQIGSLLFLQIDLIVVNILFGAASAGLYAIVLVWASLLRSMANTVSGVLTPVVFTYYAKGQVETLTKIMVSAVKLMGLLMALPIGLICGFAPQILTIWVGEKFAFLAPLLVLMALHLTINLAVLPLFSINVAYNKIRIPGVVTLLMGGMNIALAIAIPLMAGWGFYGVAVAGAIVLTLKNAIFTPWYATKVMGTKASTFNASMLPGMIATIVIIGVSMAIGILLPITSLASLILVGCIIGVVYLALIWKYGLSIFERGIFKNYYPKISGGMSYKFL